MIDIPRPVGPLQHGVAQLPLSQNDSRLWQTARAVEASFLAEMFTAAGAGQVPEGFGGGIGEDQFASLLVRAQAERIADRGGIGLAEMIMRATLSTDANSQEQTT